MPSFRIISTSFLVRLKLRMSVVSFVFLLNIIVLILTTDLETDILVGFQDEA